MKTTNIINLLAILFIASACANVEKMVDSGNYDQALEVAVRKLAGKKQKKAKYVKAAEEAFAKVTKRDMNRINQLRTRNGVQDWEKIYSISNNMIRRQNNIQPLLPLLDKEGYHAGFTFVRAEVFREQARDVLSEAYYEMANEALLKGRNADKLAAREAFGLYNRVLDFKSNYQEAEHYATKLRN